MNEPRVLFFDLETAPVLAYVWGLFKQNVGLSQIVEDSYILTWAAKWRGEDDIIYDALPLHNLFKKSKKNDLHIVESMWHLLDEADIIVAQNGDRFDVPKINTAFLKHGFHPPSPYKKIDTLKIAKHSFRLTSNKLDWMARFLFDDRKLKTDFELWLRCMAGEQAAWDEMIEYNIKDVVLLEDVYNEFVPWARTHPNMALYVDDDDPMCPRCMSRDIKRNGTKTSMTPLGKYQQYYCKECGTYPRGRTNLNTKVKQKSLLTNSL